MPGFYKEDEYDIALAAGIVEKTRSLMVHLSFQEM